jgi:hypothetical protein
MKDSLGFEAATMEEDLFLPVSDYVLAALRRAFDATHETFVRWHLKPAGNGATLMTPDEESVEVLFYRPSRFTGLPPEYADATLVCPLNDMVVTVRRWPAGPPQELTTVIKEAHAEAYYLAMARPDRMQMLRLVQVDCSFEAPSPEERESLGHEIGERIGALLGATANVTFDPVLRQVPRLSMEMDLEFPLREALTEAEAVERLLPFFPALEPPLTGDGQIVISHYGGQCVHRALKTAHVTGRHFYLPMGEG